MPLTLGQLHSARAAERAREAVQLLHRSLHPRRAPRDAPRTAASAPSALHPASGPAPGVGGGSSRWAPKAATATAGRVLSAERSAAAGHGSETRAPTADASTRAFPAAATASLLGSHSLLGTVVPASRSRAPEAGPGAGAEPYWVRRGPARKPRPHGNALPPTLRGCAGAVLQFCLSASCTA